MKNIRGRWLWFAVCIAGAVLLLLCGWLIPVYLRAVDLAVLQRAGAQAAQNEPVRASSRVQKLLNNGDILRNSDVVTVSVIRLENRARILDFLEAAPSPAAHQLLRCRELTNTVLFPCSSSSSGQAFDAAVSVCGLLLEEDSLSPALRETLLARAATALGGGNTEPVEEVLMDMMSLGQRFNWEQLAVLVHRVDDPRTLDLLALQARNAGAKTALLLSAAELSQNPGAVAAYLNTFSQSGLDDLGTSLRYGSGGLRELLRRNQRIHASTLRGEIASFAPLGFFFRSLTDCALRERWIALTVKWLFYLSGGFLLAAALHAVRATPVIEEPLRVRGFHVFRELLFALGFLLVVLLLSEPFLAQDSQKAEFPLRLRLPGVGSAAAVARPDAKPKLMNAPSLLTLLLFFVLQGLIYTACLVKLAEIRRQRIAPRIQLKLLENEDHLFDAGLYLGFCGTIVSLILVSLGIIQPSLMAAYSSTSFGIIVVSIFKIFHLRPARRQLLLQSEAHSGVVDPPAPAQASYATTT